MIYCNGAEIRGRDRLCQENVGLWLARGDVMSCHVM